MKHSVSSNVRLPTAFRVVAGCTMLMASVFWFGAGLTMAVALNELQYCKSLIELMSLSSLISALAQAVVFSNFPKRMLWPLSSGKCAFIASTTYFFVCAFDLVRELNDEGIAMGSFWIEAPK